MFRFIYYMYVTLDFETTSCLILGNLYYRYLRAKKHYANILPESLKLQSANKLWNKIIFWAIIPLIMTLSFTCIFSIDSFMYWASAFRFFSLFLRSFILSYSFSFHSFILDSAACITGQRSCPFAKEGADERESRLFRSLLIKEKWWELDIFCIFRTDIYYMKLQPPIWHGKTR